MNTEEKILAILEKHSEILAQVQETQKQMRGDLADVKDRLGTVEAVQAQMQDEIHLTNVRIDLDVGKRLEALAEGQSIIEKRLDTLEGTMSEVKELAEKTSDKVDVIHAVVAQHSGAIAELKKAR